MLFTIFLIFAYGCGSLSSAIIVCHLFGLPDPRTQGSKNPGATNVLRMGGKKAALLTLLGDIFKGVIPVIAAKFIGFDLLFQAFIACAAFLGHLYPLFFGFKGGKGVATAFGAIIALSWPVGVAIALTWLTTAFLFRYSSLAALVSALLAPFYTAYFNGPVIALIIAAMSVLLLYRHRQNIKNLWTGCEKKIGKK